jgi:hypothetical protein
MTTNTGKKKFEKMNKKQLTEAQMQELLLRMKKNYTYDAATGRLTSSRLGRAIRGKKLGRWGYLCVLCRLDKREFFIYLHHAVWAVCKGCWPTQQIDHINGDKTDNRIENLREVCGSENKMNMLLPWKPNAQTGLPGVCPHGNEFETRIHGKKFFFHDPYETFYHATMCGKRYKPNEK